MSDTQTTRPTMRYWQVKVTIAEGHEQTLARAILRLEPAREIEATGRSTRHPDDPMIHGVGDELAVARALHALADRLTECAGNDIACLTGQPVPTLQTR